MLLNGCLKKMESKGDRLVFDKKELKFSYYLFVCTVFLMFVAFFRWGFTVTNVALVSIGILIGEIVVIIVIAEKTKSKKSKKAHLNKKKYY